MSYVHVPCCRRVAHNPCPGGVVADASVRVVLVEGLFLITPPDGAADEEGIEAGTCAFYDHPTADRCWVQVTELLDRCLFLAVSRDACWRAVLQRRRRLGGAAHSEADIRAHFEGVDGPNFEATQRAGEAADITARVMADRTPRDVQLAMGLPLSAETWPWVDV